MATSASFAATMVRGLVDDERFSDVTFLCKDGARVGANRAMLIKCSSAPFFKSALEGGFKGTSEVDMGAVDKQSMLTVLQYAYSGSLSGLIEADASSDRVLTLLAAADYLQIAGLQRDLLRHMRRNMTPALGVAMLASPWAFARFPSAFDEMRSPLRRICDDMQMRGLYAALLRKGVDSLARLQTQLDDGSLKRILSKKDAKTLRAAAQRWEDLSYDLVDPASVVLQEAVDESEGRDEFRRDLRDLLANVAMPRTLADMMIRAGFTSPQHCLRMTHADLRALHIALFGQRDRILTAFRSHPWRSDPLMDRGPGRAVRRQGGQPMIGRGINMSYGEHHAARSTPPRTAPAAAASADAAAAAAAPAAAAAAAAAAPPRLSDSEASSGDSDIDESARGVDDSDADSDDDDGGNANAAAGAYAQHGEPAYVAAPGAQDSDDDDDDGDDNDGDNAPIDAVHLRRAAVRLMRRNANIAPFRREAAAALRRVNAANLQGLSHSALRGAGLMLFSTRDMLMTFIMRSYPNIERLARRLQREQASGAGGGAGAQAAASQRKLDRLQAAGVAVLARKVLTAARKAVRTLLPAEQLAAIVALTTSDSAAIPETQLDILVGCLDWARIGVDDVTRTSSDAAAVRVTRCAAWRRGVEALVAHKSDFRQALLQRMLFSAAPEGVARQTHTGALESEVSALAEEVRGLRQMRDEARTAKRRMERIAKLCGGDMKHDDDEEDERRENAFKKLRTE